MSNKEKGKTYTFESGTNNEVQTAESKLESEEITQKLIDLMITDNSKNPVDFKRDFKELIEEGIHTNCRFIYSPITQSVYNGGQYKEIIIANVGFLRDVINEETNSTQERKKVLLKVYDHYMLAVQQYDNLVEKQKSTTIDLEKTILESQQMEKTLNEAILRLDKPATDLVSILGIFTGIAFITFGGINMTSNLANELSKPNGLKNGLVGVLFTGIVLLNSLVVLMQYVKSITDKNVRVIQILWVKENKKLGKPGIFIWLNLILLLLLLAVKFVFN
ncbi:hypothetical protein PT126_05320 [Erysipelothrix rhusiopathiae]|nr:hypothetical protein [Erysipelothrix rhusiopathiae]